MAVERTLQWDLVLKWARSEYQADAQPLLAIEATRHQTESVLLIAPGQQAMRVPLHGWSSDWSADMPRSAKASWAEEDQITHYRLLRDGDQAQLLANATTPLTGAQLGQRSLSFPAQLLRWAWLDLRASADGLAPDIGLRACLAHPAASTMRPATRQPLRQQLHAPRDC